MAIYLIFYGAQGEMSNWEADSPMDAIELFIDSEIVNPSIDAAATITDVMLCTPIQNYELDGTLFAFSRDGSYFGADALEVAVVPQETLDRSADGEEDLEYYFKELGNAGI